MRSAINRHLRDLGRSIDIVRDKELKSANNNLDGMLKTRTKTGASRTTNHKAVIHSKDLERINFPRIFTQQPPMCELQLVSSFRFTLFRVAPSIAHGLFTVSQICEQFGIHHTSS